MRRRLCALGVAMLFLASADCARRVPPPAQVAPMPAPVRVAPPASLDDVEPALLELEDRRAFDGPTLAASARSRDPMVRARTALAIGRIGDERGADLLRPLLGDPSEEVAAAAAFSAGILGGTRLAPDLAGALGHAPPGVAARAAWSLGFLEQPEGQNALIAALPESANPARRAALLRALWRFSTPEAAAAAAPFAKEADPEVRAAALYALARRPQDVSLPILTGCLDDSDADVAAVCARGLGLLGKRDSIAPLSAVLQGRRAPVTINAMAALDAVLERDVGRSLDDAARERVLALAGDANPNLAVPALALLRWSTQDPGVFRRLWGIATSGSGRRRAVALQSLMRGLGEKALPLASTASGDPDPFVRAAVAESLSSLPAGSGAALRQKLFGDHALVVRLKVLEGMKTLDDVRASPGILREAFADPDPGIRAAALDARAPLADEETFAAMREAVVGAYGDGSPDVAIAAIAAAETTPASPEARAVVEAAYRHPSSILVSRLARRSLLKKFGADPATLEQRSYPARRTRAEYASLLAEAKKPWSARVETARGPFRVRLAGVEAPITVMNFLTLARKGYFDGAPIHRVVPNFVVQDGDPTGTGNGGPGYEIRDEINTIPYGAGTVGMALAGPDTGGSQWFVTHAPEPHLDGGYTVFGRVTQGMDVVNRIEQGDEIVRITAELETR